MVVRKTPQAASGENDTSWAEVIQVLWWKVLERFPKPNQYDAFQSQGAYSLSNLPNILATLLQPALCPPLRTTADPHVPPILRMQRLIRHAKLEIFHLLTALRHLSVPIQRLELNA